jgi:hypothetical protein
MGRREEGAVGPTGGAQREEVLEGGQAGGQGCTAEEKARPRAALQREGDVLGEGGERHHLK